MRLLILLLAIVIGSARGRDCHIEMDDTLDPSNTVMTFDDDCTELYSGSTCIVPQTVETIYFPPSITTINSRTLFGCNSIKYVTLPNGLKTIEEHAFGETGLTSVVFPNSLTSIGVGAFFYTGLTSVVFPPFLTSIGDYAFFNTPLTSVTFPYTLPYMTIGTDAFTNTNINHVSIAIEAHRSYLPPSLLDSSITVTIRTPCTEGNYHSDACKNKIAEEYSQTKFIELYNRNYTSTCN